MEIYNMEKHRACFCYGAGKGALIEMQELPCGTIQENLCLSLHEMVFLVKGRLSYKICEYNQAELTEGNFIFVPVGRTVSYKTETDCLLFIIRQANGLRLCQTFSIEQLYNKSGEKHRPREIMSLKINPRLSYYLNGLRDVYMDGMLCRYFFETKITELFVLLRAYYSNEQLNRLFLPILSPDTEFSEFVRRNYAKYKTVNEMAAAMCLTPVQFASRFRKIFLQSPRKWMQQEKAKQIFVEICDSSRPLKQISDDYGFAVQAHLNRFCRKIFGMAPREMREKNRNR